VELAQGISIRPAALVALDKLRVDQLKGNIRDWLSLAPKVLRADILIDLLKEETRPKTATAA
jgi:hypothetical protein